MGVGEVTYREGTACAKALEWERGCQREEGRALGQSVMRRKTEEEEEEEEGAARPRGAHCLSWQGRDNSRFSKQHRGICSKEGA